MNTIGTIAQTDVYFVAAWFSFCIGVIVGFVLAGGYDDKGADQEDQEDAAEGA